MWGGIVKDRVLPIVRTAVSPQVHSSHQLLPPSPLTRPRGRPFLPCVITGVSEANATALGNTIWQARPPKRALNKVPCLVPNDPTTACLPPPPHPPNIIQPAAQAGGVCEACCPNSACAAAVAAPAKYLPTGRPGRGCGEACCPNSACAAAAAPAKYLPTGRPGRGCGRSMLPELSACPRDRAEVTTRPTPPPPHTRHSSPPPSPPHPCPSPLPPSHRCFPSPPHCEHMFPIHSPQ